MLPEFLQGIFVAGATGLALVPILTDDFGLSFEAALAYLCIQTVLIASSPILFGEPYAPGWITPALPLALLYVVQGYPTPQERFQAMAATTLVLTAILLILGLTGIGERFLGWIPPVFKAAIIMGAAISAFVRVFIIDLDRYLLQQPLSTTAALVICLLLVFSNPLRRFGMKYRLFRWVVSLGLLPSFVVAGLVGPLAGEISYQVDWGFLLPPFGELVEKASPFSIGWPPARVFLESIPLALLGYLLFFGDLVTGQELVREGVRQRPDEPVSLHNGSTHLSMAVRNLLMAILAPFFPSQGILWTGVHVIIVKKWAEGRNAMRSLFDGISSYYMFGIPFVYFVLPFVTTLRPLMGITLSLTLVLTGFACFAVAIRIPGSFSARGVTLVAGAGIAILPPWAGLLTGVAIVSLYSLVAQNRRANSS
jgi:hypothetical protein